MKKDKAVLLAAAVTLFSGLPVYGDTWTNRPGLWEVMTMPDMSASSVPTSGGPQTITRQFCQAASNHPVQSIFDPATTPGKCSESILSETASAREIEDVCQLPAEPQSPAVAGGSPQPVMPFRAHRHIILTGEGAGTIDLLEISGPGVTRRMRWLGDDCGTAAPMRH